MKKTQNPVIVTVASIMFILCVLSFFPDSDGFSAFENRYLSKRPALSINSLFSGEFEDRYEEYLLDNFALRDLSVMGYQSYSGMFFLDAFSQSEDVLMSVDVDSFVTAVEQEAASEAGQQPAAVQAPVNGAASVGGSTSSGGSTSFGGWALVNESAEKDGQPSQEDQIAPAGTISADGIQDIASQQSDTEQASDEEQSDARLNNSLIIHGDRIMMPTGANGLKAFGSLLSDIALKIPGVNFYSVTGPTSAAFYASPQYSTGSYDQSKAEAIIQANAEGVTVVSAYDRLSEHSDEDIYFRSDVHWTALGAYYAYTAFCESAGLTPAGITEDFTMNTYEPFLGGLYSQIYKLPQAARLKNNPEKLDYYIPKLGHRLTLYKMGNLKDSYKVDSIINTNFKSLGAYKYSCFAWGD